MVKVYFLVNLVAIYRGGLHEFADEQDYGFFSMVRAGRCPCSSLGRVANRFHACSGGHNRLGSPWPALPILGHMAARDQHGNNRHYISDRIPDPEYSEPRR